MTTTTKKPFLLKAAEGREKMESYSHPFNPKSEIRGTALSRETGLSRVGVSFVTIPPGKESFAYHTHFAEEEWVYVLSGRGIAYVDGKEHEIGPGDFLGFPTPSVAHQLRNPFGEDLVYLMGGENRSLEVADFPELGRRMVRTGEDITIYDTKSGRPFGPE